MAYFYTAIAALLLLACDVSRSLNEKAPRRVETDTLFGWRCDGQFYYADAMPGEYPERRPGKPPVLGEVIEIDTVILFISMDCPFPEAQTSKKVTKPLEAP